MAVKYVRLLTQRLRAAGLGTIILVQYIDNLLITTPTFHTLKLAQAIMDDLLAFLLGIIFKASKDVGLDKQTTSLEILGVQLNTAGIQVTVSPTRDKVANNLLLCIDTTHVQVTTYLKV